LNFRFFRNINTFLTIFKNTILQCWYSILNLFLKFFQGENGLPGSQGIDGDKVSNNIKYLKTSNLYTILYFMFPEY